LSPFSYSPLIFEVSSTSGVEKIADKGKFVWKKVQGKQNHFWDCRIYNMAAKDISVNEILKSLKVQNGTFSDFVRIIKQQ